MEREGRVGRRPDTGVRPTQTSPIWEAFNSWVRQTPTEVRVQGAVHGEWPKGTPQVFVDFYTRTTPEERLLGSIFGDYPSPEEIQARPPDYVARMSAGSVEQRRGRLIKLLGEPEDTTVSLEELEAKYVQTLRERVEQVLGAPTSTERHVLEGSFGLADGHPRTQREIAEEIGRSPRTVRRIKKRAIERLQRDLHHED